MTRLAGSAAGPPRRMADPPTDVELSLPTLAPAGTAVAATPAPVRAPAATAPAVRAPAATPTPPPGPRPFDPFPDDSAAAPRASAAPTAGSAPSVEGVG